MAFRLVEISLPEEFCEQFQGQLSEIGVLVTWIQPLADGNMLVRLVLAAESTEPLLDLIQKNYGSLEEVRTIVLLVEASLPREKAEEPGQSPGGEPQPEEHPAKPDRISREELYEDVLDASRFSPTFLAMIVLSSIVAAIGVLRNNVAVIIGAMVIAPLLGPNVALALATTLGDASLARRAVRINLIGIILALLLSTILGVVLEVDPSVKELVIRTRVDLGDLALALASGTAGALAFTTGVSSILVGVMVAVALLPPLAACGLLLGSGYFQLAGGALLLFLTNLICINLTGVITFLVQGISPLHWWEANQARKFTRKAIVIWVILLAALIGAILLSTKT